MDQDDRDLDLDRGYRTTTYAQTQPHPQTGEFFAAPMKLEPAESHLYAYEDFQNHSGAESVQTHSQNQSQTQTQLPGLVPQPQFHHYQQPGVQFHAASSGDAYDYNVAGSDAEELRMVAMSSLKYPIEHAAQIVRDDEDGPLSEQSRRVFGMGWLMRNCVLDADSNVPRNRVYASYIDTCNSLNLRPLPHSIFGKLVRAAFPGLKTRRLGMRGQSKYHYCGLQLAEDTPGPPTPLESVSHVADPQMPKPLDASGMQLPALGDFVSLGARDGDDNEAQRESQLRALSGLYETQCRTFLELFEAMDIKNLLDATRAFQHRLSTSLRQLFNEEPALSEWAGACDSRIYCRAIVGLSRAALQQLPENMSDRVRTLMLHLPHEIRLCSARIAESLMSAKLAAAAPFIDLLGRFLRVNKSATTASDMLRSASHVAVMRADWLNAVTPYATRAAPSCCRPDEIWRRLHNDIPNLLADPTADVVEPLQPWVQYLAQTLEQYNTTALEHVQLGISSVASAALRDLTMANSQAFGHWWLLRCWIDEWLCWTSDLTSFMRAAS